MDDVRKFLALVDADLLSRRKLLLMILAVREDPNAPRGWSCFPRQRRLAAEVGCSLATLKRDLKYVRGEGLLSSTSRNGELCNYTLNLAAIEKLPRAFSDVSAKEKRMQAKIQSLTKLSGQAANLKKIQGLLDEAAEEKKVGKR